MKPPIYSNVQPDETPQHFMGRARMFKQAATAISCDYVNGQQNWPKYALLCHAAELALKAFVRAKEAQGTAVRTHNLHNHNLLGWYQLSVQCGLTHSVEMEENIGALSELHHKALMRYPKRHSRPIPDLSFTDGTVEELISFVSPFINSR